MTEPFPPDTRTESRERILVAAHDLFSRHGTRSVGIDRIAARAGVARTTLYRHFATKDELVLEYLRRREELWTRQWLQGEVEARAETAPERLLAIFDVFNEWFQRPDYEGCAFINVVLENDDRDSPVRRAGVAHLSTIREFLARLALEAGIAEPDLFARRWHILMKGSIVAAQEGDVDAALRAREIAALVLADARVRDEQVLATS